MSDTALGAKLKAKGFLPRNIDLQVAIAKYQNAGGEYGVALAILNAAFGRGKSERDLELSRIDAAPGHSLGADKATRQLPDAAPNATEGQSRSADKASASLPSVAPQNGKDATKPGHARRGLNAIISVQDTVAKSLFDSTKLPDGRSLREVLWAEVPHLAQRYTFLSRVMMAVHRRGVPVNPDAKLDALVSEKELGEIISAVERLNDIH